MGKGRSAVDEETLQADLKVIKSLNEPRLRTVFADYIQSRNTTIVNYYSLKRGLQTKHKSNWVRYVMLEMTLRKCYYVHMNNIRRTREALASLRGEELYTDDTLRRHCESLDDLDRRMERDEKVPSCPFLGRTSFNDYRTSSL